MADTFTVDRSATIAAPPEQVYGRIVDLRKWEAWSPWEGLDPDVQKTFTGPNQGVGATYAWTGNRKVGEGRMEITEVSEPDRVEIALDFIKPFKASNTTIFTLRPDGEGTHVTWTMIGPMTFLTRAMGIFRSMDKMVGPDFEKGLTNLKRVAERTV